MDDMLDIGIVEMMLIISATPLLTCGMIRNMQVYFGASISRYRKLLPVYQSIVAIIEDLGHTVLSKHVIQEKTTKGDWQKQYCPQELFYRELHRLQRADVLVAEVTTPSWGTAFLIEAAIQNHKPLLCLYYGLDERSVPLMLRGHTAINLHLYTEDSVRSLLAKFFSGINSGK